MQGLASLLAGYRRFRAKESKGVLRLQGAAYFAIHDGALHLLNEGSRVFLPAA